MMLRHSEERVSVARMLNTSLEASLLVLCPASFTRQCTKELLLRQGLPSTVVLGTPEELVYANEEVAATSIINTTGLMLQFFHMKA